MDRRKAGSKHHLLVDGGGTPLAGRLTGANRYDSTQLIALVDGIPPVRGKPGRPLRRPKLLLADRGYDYDDKCRRPPGCSRRWPTRWLAKCRRLRERHITPAIARKGDPHGSGLGA